MDLGTDSLASPLTRILESRKLHTLEPVYVSVIFQTKHQVKSYSTIDTIALIMSL